MTASLMNNHRAIHEVTDLADRNRLDEIQHKVNAGVDQISGSDAEFLVSLIALLADKSIDARNEAYRSGRFAG